MKKRRGFARKRKVKCWQKEISKVMDDFCLPNEQIKQIVSAVQSSASGKETQLLMYERAWNKMFDHIGR